MSVGSILFAYALIHYQEEGMLENLTNYALFSANHIKSGIHYGMLTAQPDVIQRTVEVIGSVEEVLDIKVTDSQGVVAYAKDRSEIGHRMDFEMEQVERAANSPLMVKGRDGRKALELFSPIYNEPSCYTAACHAHRQEDKVLGALFTTFSASKIETESRKHLIGMLAIGAVSVGLFSVFLCIILYNFVSKPVALLEEGMKRLSKGDFDQPIEIKTRDEMGLLASTFNSMSSDIKRYRENMENWTKALQEEVDKKTAEIMRAQEQLIDAEKLASLGRMAAGIAHELNSPLTGIVTFAHLMRKRVEKDRQEDAEDLDVIIEQANRCSKIIKGLLGFARKGAHEKIQINMNALIEATIAMVRNQAKFHDIQLRIDLADIPPVFADPNQLQQVFLNMLTNAADAMNDVGVIRIATRRLDKDGRDFIEVEFSDSGPGIPQEHMGKIFEPFFTTKAVGKGTGLGLPISYGIVKRLGGDISVSSEVGKGATFLIRLPVNQQE